MGCTPLLSSIEGFGRKKWPLYRGRRSGKRVKERELYQRHYIVKVQPRPLNRVFTRLRTHNPNNCVPISLGRTMELLFEEVSTMANDERFQEVLKYWYGNEDDPSTRAQWFGGGEKVDTEIREKFGALVQLAETDQLKHWEDDPTATLALIILQDQFCRSIYRGTARAFARDKKCEQLTKKMLKNDYSFYKSLPSYKQAFLLLPLMHAEDLECQDLAVKYFEEMVEKTKGTSDEKAAVVSCEFAKKHQEIIKIYGRFVGRNKALGRTNTPEEQEFLDNPPPGYSF